MTKDQLNTALAEVTARKTIAESEHADLARQREAIQLRGVEVEKAILGIDGELKALTAIEALCGE